MRMEMYKSLVICKISNEEERESFENELLRRGFERISEESVYALSMEIYQVKVQAIKAYLRVYGMKHFSADDTLLFIETRMNEEHTLVGMLQTDLLNEQE